MYSAKAAALKTTLYMRKEAMGVKRTRINWSRVKSRIQKQTQNTYYELDMVIWWQYMLRRPRFEQKRKEGKTEKRQIGVVR